LHSALLWDNPLLKRSDMARDSSFTCQPLTACDQRKKQGRLSLIGKTTQNRKKRRWWQWWNCLF